MKTVYMSDILDAYEESKANDAIWGRRENKYESRDIC